MSENFDLLGDPIPEGHGRRGRPQHIATARNRNKVIMLLALGWSNERIAQSLGITAPTLRRNYFRELKVRLAARDRLEGNLVEMLWEQSKAGNVAAIKEFRKVMDRHDLMDTHFALRERDDKAKTAKLGKKEQAVVDAHAPDTGSAIGAIMARRAQGTLN